MARFVVEPAVIMKWFVPEENSRPAARLLDGGNELIAPDTVLAETAGIVTAKIRLEEITEEEGMQIAASIRSLPLNIKPAAALLEAALHIASGLDFPFRDGLNLALTVQEECRLVTANDTLYDKVRESSFARYVKWVGDIR